MAAIFRRCRYGSFIRAVAVGLCVAGMTVEIAHADEKYPSHEIRAIVPFPPGGAIDAGVRIIQSQISAHLGVPFVVVNRAGASGTIGTGAVASAAADGYTVAATPSTTLTLAGVTNRNLPYKVEDFIPLGTYAVDVGVIVVHADSPWKTLKDLVAYARQNPGKLSYGSPGAGSVSSFAVEAIKLQHGLNMVEVPFQGSPPANTALLGKQVDFATVAFSNAAPLLQAGKLRALAVSAESRMPGYLDVPTLAEDGVAYGSLGLTLGLYVRTGTPAGAVDLLAEALRVAMKNPATRESLEKTGLFVRYTDRNGAQRQLDAEHREVQELGRKLKLVP